MIRAAGPTYRDRPGDVLPPPERRGLNRVEAAAYVGIGVTKFDEMVSDGRMPPPKRIDGRKVWDRRRLDFAFEALPDEGPDIAAGPEDPYDGGFAA